MPFFRAKCRSSAKCGLTVHMGDIFFLLVFSERNAGLRRYGSEHRCLAAGSFSLMPARITLATGNLCILSSVCFNDARNISKVLTGFKSPKCSKGENKKKSQQ